MQLLLLQHQQQQQQTTTAGGADADAAQTEQEREYEIEGQAATVWLMMLTNNHTLQTPSLLLAHTRLLTQTPTTAHPFLPHLTHTNTHNAS